MVDISVIIPYNRDRGWLSEAISSYEAQVFTGTSELILSHGPNQSCAENFNQGWMLEAQGKYIKKLDEDDLMLPNCLQDLFDYVEENDLDVVFAQSIHIGDGEDQIVIPKFTEISLDALLFNNFIDAQTTLYSHNLLRELGGFDEYLQTAEEYEFHLRALSSNYSFGYLSKVVAKYRHHSSNKSRILRASSMDRVKYIEEIRGRFT
jgi:GT2 family glycosyltransferase